MKLVAYLRVSTDRQAEEGLRLDVQEQDRRPTVPLPEYLSAALRVDRERRFNEMLAWFTEAR